METLRREELLLLDDDDAANDDDCRSARANIVVVKALFVYYSVLFV
jgi:hypothetical protein